MALPTDIINEKNRTASPYAWLVLLEITLTDDTIIRLVRNDEDVTFESNVYTAFNFQLEPTVQNSKGQIPTLTLRVSNVTFLIQSKLQTLNGAIGSTVRMIVVNSNLLASNVFDLEMNFEVLAASSSNQWVEFELGSPSPLRQRFPLNKYSALGCQWRFEEIECDYDRKILSAVVLTNPVSLGIVNHNFEVDAAITLYTVNGITGGIEGNYLVKTVTDIDNILIKTLAGDDVNGADFGGAYTSGGFVGYTTCERTLTACRERENQIRFGGFPGMRSGGVRIA